MNDLLPYIDRYFNCELSTEEKKVFENRCLSDPAFARMVAFYISLQEHSQQQWAERKKEQFAQLEVEAFSADETSFSTNGELEINEHYGEKERLRDINTIEEKDNSELQKEAPLVSSLQKQSLRKKEAKVRLMKRWKRLAVAAAILGMIAIGITWYVQTPKQGNTVAANTNKGDSTKDSSASNNASAQNNSAVDSAVKQKNNKQETPKNRLSKEEQQQLYAQNFIPDASPERQSELLMLEDAFEHYKHDRYKQANTAYEKAQKEVESLTTRTLEDEDGEAERKRILFYAQYYNAQSYLAAGNTFKAISELKAIKESPNGYWHSKQQWYLALAYIKLGDVAKATTLLQQVADSKQAREYRQKAIQLSKALQEE